MLVPLYDREMNRIGMLHRASKVGYKHVKNDLYTASFELPAHDEDNALCDMNTHAIIDIMDGSRSAGKYRIADEPETEITKEGAFLRYSCEHVLAFLFDDRIDGYMEIGGTGVYTEDVIRRILSLQEVGRWKLGRCDFHYQFQYSWEHEDLLNALYAIPKCFADEYRWTYDTSSYPWTINLVRAPTEPSCEIYPARNEQSITRGKDRSKLCTRLYCYGSGEGVNQTNIRRVNPTGKSYIDSPNRARHGTICKHLIDPSISDENVLFAKGKAYLQMMDHPLYSYAFKAVDLYRMTGMETDRLDEGLVVRVRDERYGIEMTDAVVSYEKKDVEGDPLDADVVIAAQSSDTSSTIEELAARSSIAAQYAQGATNLFPMQVMDNADAAHPATLRFFVPATCVKINACLLSWRLSAFRAYETGAAAGGGTSTTTFDGGGSTQTSGSGGGSTQTSSSGGGGTRTSEAGGQETVTVPGRTVRLTQYTGRAVDTEVLGTLTHTGYPVAPDALTSLKTDTGAASGNTGRSAEQSTGVSRNANGAMISTGEAGTHTHGGGSHRHGAGDTHRHTFDGVGVGKTGYTSYNGAGNTTYTSVTTDDAGSHAHSMSHWHQLDGHTHTLGGHTHDMSHRHNMDHQHTMTHDHAIPAMDVSIPSHTHRIVIPEHAHDVTIPYHTHQIDIPAHSHSFTLLSHTHEIVYGIYEGGVASKVSIEVDGTKVPDNRVGNSEIDVIPYMGKDGNGRITRGVWHEIRLVPNSLTRIEANLFVQTFITSYTGGNY